VFFTAKLYHGPSNKA